jgi:hypothetical protein
MHTLLLTLQSAETHRPLSRAMIKRISSHLFSRHCHLSGLGHVVRQDGSTLQHDISSVVWRATSGSCSLTNTADSTRNSGDKCTLLSEACILSGARIEVEQAPIFWYPSRTAFYWIGISARLLCTTPLTIRSTPSH